MAKPSKKRKAKLLSLILAVLVAIMVLATTIVVNFSEDFGGDAPEYDSPNYKDGVFENVETTTLSNDETSLGIPLASTWLVTIVARQMRCCPRKNSN